MQQGDYTSSSSSSAAPYYQFPHLQNPIPNPSSDHSFPINHYASAPPFSPNYTPSPDFTTFSQFPDSTPPPTAPNNFTSPFESQPSNHHQPYYPPYDQNQNQTPPNYAPPNSSLYNNTSAPYTQAASSVPPVPSYEHPGGEAYFGDGYLNLNPSHSDSGYNSVSNSRYEPVHDEGYGDGVYAYQGGKVEPYGAHGTATKFDDYGATKFDDYGRSISFSAPKESSVPVASSKIVKAVPKVDALQGLESVVQKFRVKLLPESGGQSTLDVLCQIGLDGIRMLDPNTSRTLRIYPLENITRCDKLDSSTLAFWSKSPVDIEPRRIRLQSNSYTNNTLLDTVTAATIQFKEMYESRRPAESLKTNEKPTEKKKGFGDWVNMIKPANEEKDHWVPDEAVSKCTACGTDFGAFIRKHHCRNCGDIFCDKCTHGRIALTADENAQPVRVCDRCMAEVTQRLSSAKESSSKPLLQTHEDLARKLQEELTRNLKISGSKSDGSERRMKEVECPICTVHLQVQVPSSGSETIECGVCQHPFLVSAH
ncbi:hypothetical protein RIF29_12933 [Crotalaria pallida]|uniref:FYVE-type domain-containing protein n=1 Tax=Crotalaria pallida TaxID=3830 RepID=A0AAN9INQ0_CROPI